ncbi:MAG: CheR family methyltransferase [Desulfobacteraceae bacterium]
MRAEQIEEIEIALLLDAIRKRYGYDFRNYARASLKRRLRSFAAQQDRMPLSRMIPAVLQDESFGARLIHGLSVTVSEMFRDPAFYAAIREQVIPYLKTYPFIRIWHAGCATGEEVYSLAIVLQEEGFYDRTTIFATDFNEQALDRAREAIYPLDAMKNFTSNYQRSGGRRAFSDYYRSGYDAAILDAGLKRNVTIANHNLVTDGVFSEVHLVLCRNVLIYFDQTLQNRALGLFNDSLVHGGILALGSKETLQYSRIAEDYKPLSSKWKIYQKTTA